MNIDLAIVLVFLSINLISGLHSGRGITSIREFAIGDRNFSTAAITATIVATWISGSYFAVNIAESYKEGAWFIIAKSGESIALLTIGWVFGPRLGEFFGNLSVADTMGKLYGQKVRFISAIAAIAQAIGVTALQIKVFSSVFTHFLSIPADYATIVSSCIVISYSTFGGIKSVTFTDAIQFITFGVFIPILTLFIYKVVGSYEAVEATISTHPNFNIQELLNIHNPKFWPYFFLLLYFSFPGLNPTMYQRTLMAKNTQQIRESLATAAIVALLIHIFTCFIGLIILSHNPNLEPNDVAMYVINNYSFSGLRGLAVISVIAIVMSTADSWLNSASILFSHDLIQSIGIKLKNELLYARISTVVIGILSLVLALYSDSLLKLFLLQANFYRPIVTIPLILAILRWRSNSTVVLIAMAAGGSTVLIWRNFIQPITGIESIMPAMFANLIAFIIAYYALGKPGGWIKREPKLI